MDDQPENQPQDQDHGQDAPASKPEKHTVASLAARTAEVERTIGIRRDLADGEDA